MSSGAEKVDTLKTSIAKSETSTNEVEGQSSGPAKSHEEATPTSTEPVSFSTSVEEKSGKGIFSLFGTSSSGQIQPQSGKSILGGIPPGSSSPKEIPGTGLFSIFGSPGPQSHKYHLHLKSHLERAYFLYLGDLLLSHNLTSKVHLCLAQRICL